MMDSVNIHNINISEATTTCIVVSMAVSAQQFWDSKAIVYDEKVDNILGKGLRPAIAGKLKAEKGLGKTVEFGCGTGYFTPALAGAAESVVATDISEGMVRLAGERLKGLKNVTVAKADCTKTSYASATFDTAYLGLVLQFTDASATLAEMKRILNPGGALLITVPVTTGGPISSVRMIFRFLKAYGTAGPKAVAYTDSSLRAALEQCGFKVTAVELIKSPTDGLGTGALYARAIKK